jgi:hypothetical protein
MQRFVLGVLLILTLVAVGIAAAPPLTFTFSDVHANKTAIETDTYAVNNYGTIAGDYVDTNGVQHGMVHGAPTTTFDYAKCTSSIAGYGISTGSTVAGWCINSNGIPIGFTWTKRTGKFVDINFPKGTGTEVNGINDKGDLAGTYFDSGGIQHGFIKKAGGAFKSFDVTGDTAATAWGINNAGVACVYAFNSSGDYDSFLYDGKTFKKVGYPKAGPLGSVCHTPNNKGDVVGTYYDTNGAVHGWLLHGGKYYPFDDPKASNSTRGDGLNDTLEIVGRYTPSTGGNFGFKATVK